MFKTVFNANANAVGYHYFSARGAEKLFNLDIADINLFGEVGFDFTDASVIAALAGRGDVTINLNSRGGDYYQGLAIYNALRTHSGEVTIRVLGIAASAASVILMAADKREIAPVAQVMVHNASVITSGNKAYLAKVIGYLNDIDGQMAQIYATGTGLTPEKIAEMMDAETFLTSADALSMNFVTAIMEDKPREDGTPAPDLSACLSIANDLTSFFKQ